MGKHRVERVRQEILKAVNDILIKEIRDPRVDDVTITDVELTGDLQQATIFYSTLSDFASDRKRTREGLTKATGLVRHHLGKYIKLYKVPTIRFERDPSIDYGHRIEDLLAQIKSED